MALEEGVCTDTNLNKRSEPRLVWVRLASVRSESETELTPAQTVKTANVSSRGIGLVSRKPFDEGDQLVLTPDGVTEEQTPFESINVRVVHCKTTIQGYKVGCVFVL
jgi:hypothetical protein